MWSTITCLTLPLQVDFTNPRPREPFSLMPVTWKPSPRMLLLLTCQWHFERSFKWGSWRHVYHWFWDGCSRIDPEQKSSIASCTYGLMTASSCMIRVCAIDQAKGWVILGRSQMLSDTQEGKGVIWHWLGMKSARVTQYNRVLRIRHAVCPLEKATLLVKVRKDTQTTQMKSMKWCWVYWLLKAILILTWKSILVLVFSFLP